VSALPRHTGSSDALHRVFERSFRVTTNLFDFFYEGLPGYGKVAIGGIPPRAGAFPDPDIATSSTRL